MFCQVLQEKLTVGFLERKRLSIPWENQLAIGNFTLFWFQTGYTSLHLAAQNCHFKTVEALLKGGANPLAKNNVGYIALFGLNTTHRDL